jgi:hypothetical protein
MMNCREALETPPTTMTTGAPHRSEKNENDGDKKNENDKIKNHRGATLPNKLLLLFKFKIKL